MFKVAMTWTTFWITSQPQLYSDNAYTSKVCPSYILLNEMTVGGWVGWNTIIKLHKGMVQGVKGYMVKQVVLELTTVHQLSMMEAKGLVREGM